MMRILLLLSCLHFVIANTSNSTQTHLCCTGENIVHHSTCVNGKHIDLTCDSIAIDPDADEEGKFEFNADGDLILVHIYPEELIIHKSQYCLAAVHSDNSTNVIFLCADAVTFPSEDKWFSVRAICGIVSTCFLLATLTAYFLVPSLRDLQGKCIMHNIGALAMASLNLSIMQLSEMDNDVCKLFAFLTYFCFMTAFFWLNVTSFEIWKTVVYPEIIGTEKQWYLMYILYGHGMPIFFLMFLLIAHHTPGNHLKPGIGENTCWFRGITETWAYFYGPVAILIVLNIVMFSWCISKLWIERKTMNDLATKSLKYKVRLYIKLFVIMGVTWIFEIISSLLENVHAFLDFIWMITDYVNVLQGAYIFFLLVVLRKRALRGLADRGLCCLYFPSSWKNLEDEEILHADEENVQ